MAKRIVLILLALCAFPAIALAVPCSQVFTFATGQVLTASNLNANPANEVNCINNVDNTNIGAAGLYASQILPTNAGQATFGGSQTYTFPTSVNAVGAIYAGSTHGLALSAGDLGASRSASVGVLGLGGSSAACVMAFGSALGSAMEFTCPIGAEANGSTPSYVPPVYTTSGAAVANTLHGVQFSCTTSTSPENCTVTLTGAAVFSGAGTYACSVDYNVLAVVGSAFLVNNISGSQFVVGWLGGSTGFAIPVAGVCIGT